MLDSGNNIIVRDGSYIESRLMIPGEWVDRVNGVNDVPHSNVSSV